MGYNLISKTLMSILLGGYCSSPHSALPSESDLKEILLPQPYSSFKDKGDGMEVGEISNKLESFTPSSSSFCNHVHYISCFILLL